MSTQPIAIQSMLQAIVGTGLPPPAVSGLWTAGPITPVLATKLSVNSNKVVYSASCIFSFSGLDPGNNPVITTSTVNLNPSSTVLTEFSNSLLRLGDSNSDSYGNTLQVIGGQTILRSA